MHANGKKHTTFASINKRKVRWFFLYFYRKYEAHKASFSKEINILGRGRTFSFQQWYFSDTLIKILNQTIFLISLMTMQEVEIFGSELKERITVIKSSKTNSKQSSERSHTKQNFQRKRKVYNFFKKISR